MITVGDHRLKLTVDNRFALLDEDLFNLRWPAVAVDGEPAIPAGALVGLLSRLTERPFQREPASGPVHVPEDGGIAPDPWEGDPGQSVADSLFGPTEEVEREIPGRPVRRIVIDAGHGARDPGATGPGGVREKDITLQVAKRLRRHLLKDNTFDVVLTREKDTFLGPDERAAIANGANGDLLLSIHANASFAVDARGFEVYCIGAEGPPPEPALGDDAEFAKWEDVQRVHRDRSGEAARHIQLALAERLRILNRGVNRAAIRLLRSADLPAVLVEIGFITNPREEALLEDRAFQERVARALAEGIEDYARAAQEGAAW